MQPTAILFPVLVQVALTLGVLLALGPARARSLRAKGLTLDDRDVALGRAPWSEQATKVANNYQNQFELPVLFYAVVAFALQTGAVDTPMVVLAWIFAVSRLAHTAVHIGPNRIMWRGAAFLAGMLALAVMWVRIALHIL
jgi:hypothetical protein